MIVSEVRHGMFLSIIVPVYNGARYLGSCLDSLLEQDIEDYEILCVDDGSTDGSAGIADGYAQAHGNVRVIHQENAGVCAARNAGAAAARGDYIWFVDCDDLLAPNCLATLRAQALKTHCDRLTLGAYQFTDELTQEETAHAREGSLPSNAPWYDSVVWRSLLRRDFLTSHGLTFCHPGLTHGEDGLYMYELTQCCPRDAGTDAVVYFYRVHSGSAETAAGTAGLKKRMHSHIRIVRILLDCYRGGRQNAATADKLMSFLWLSLYELAHLSAAEAGTDLAELKQAGLFPFQRLPECTIRRSYMSGLSGSAERLFDLVYLHLNTRLGFAAMRLLLRLKALVQSLRRGA